jgi:hypothetical protein
MADRTDPFSKPFGLRVMTTGTAMVVLTMATNAAWSQTAPQSPAPPPQGVQAPAPQQAAPEQPALPSAAPPPAAPPPDNPGLLNEIGKLFGKLPPLKTPTETIDDLNARAKDAGDALSHLTTSQMVTGRVECPVSANGAPDCKSASDKLCQGKGFKEGKSLLTDSSEHCSAKVLIPGRTRKPDDCRTNTYVTRAVCQ